MRCLAVLVVLAAAADALQRHTYRGHAPHPPLPPTIHYGRRPPPPRVFYTHPRPHPRAPSHYQPFRPQQYLPSIPSRPLVAKRPPLLPWIQDDNTGPIHTIPAPNLSPSDRPLLPPGFHNPGSVEITQSLGYELPAFQQHAYHASNQQQLDSERQHAYHAQQLDSERQQAYHSQQLDSERQQAYHASNDHASPTTYYAPDPDPSLPAPKIPATTDPHSHPSNGRLPLDLAIQIQQSNNNLSPDGLLQLLNYQAPVDSYGVPLTKPEFHSFNYQEPTNQVSPLYQAANQVSPFYQASNQVSPLYQAANQVSPLYQAANGIQASGSENVERKVAKQETERNVADNQVGDEEANFYAQVGSSAYASLPNRDAAERLAELAAAGDVISRVQKKEAAKKQVQEERGDVPIEEEYEDEEDATTERQYGAKIN